MTTYRLRCNHAYNGTPDDPRPLYYRGRSPDRRYGYERHMTVEALNLRYPPTEWRTLRGVTEFLARHPLIAADFDIEEITA